MARLINLPDTVGELFRNYQNSPHSEHERFGQWVVNSHGLPRGEGWPELYYADQSTAMKILVEYYSI